MGKKIALVSRRKQVIDFFTLEARLWGHSVTVSPILPENAKGIDILIYDGAEVIPKLEGANVLRLCDGEAERSDELGFPVSLESLKGIFGEYGNVEGKDRNADVIYLRENSREIIYKNDVYALTEHEYRLLERLSEDRSDDPVPRESLMRILGADEGNIADVYVSRLRKKLETADGPRIIGTVRGKGYKLLVKVKKYT